MREVYTAPRVVETLKRAEAAGITAFQGRGDFHRIMYWLELFRREGGSLLWIAQTASEMSDVGQNIRVLAADGAAGIYHHGSSTDKLWKQGEFDTVRDRLAEIRDTGARVGLGTHMPEIIDYVESADWDIDFYMACFYNLSRIDRDSALVGGSEPFNEPFYEEDPPRMCRVIRQTRKQILAFKILAAGRKCRSQDDVRRAFQFAFDNIKPTDAVVVGMMPEDVERNVEHAAAVLTTRV